MTAMLGTIPSTAPHQPFIKVPFAEAPSAEGWVWRLVVVVLGPVVDRHPDVVLAVLRAADELVNHGPARIQGFTDRPVQG